MPDEAHLIPEADGDLASLGLKSNFPTSPEEQASLDKGMESTEQVVDDSVSPEQSMPAEVEPEPEAVEAATEEAEPEQS